MKITSNVPTSAFTLNARTTWNVLFDDNNKAVAIFSTKSRLADVAIMAPEMYELLEHIRDTATVETSTDTLNRINQLLAKIEGGGDEKHQADR